MDCTAKPDIVIGTTKQQNDNMSKAAMQNHVVGISMKDNWYYPPDTAGDLKDVNLPQATKEEIFAMSWEYARSVIPQYSNWKRYVAFQRIFIMGIIAEFRGDLVDVVAGDEVLGYNMQEVLDALFKGTPGQ